MIEILNVTGGAIRSDSWGHGAWNASRGTRKHAGVDLVVMPGQPILAPLDGEIVRRSRPYTRERLKEHFSHPANNGMVIEGYAIPAGLEAAESPGELRILVFLWYCRPLALDGTVDAGEPIALAEDVGHLYAVSRPDDTRRLGRMQAHIHLEIRQPPGRDRHQPSLIDLERHAWNL